MAIPPSPEKRLIRTEVAITGIRIPGADGYDGGERAARILFAFVLSERMPREVLASCLLWLLGFFLGVGVKRDWLYIFVLSDVRSSLSHSLGGVPAQLCR